MIQDKLNGFNSANREKVIEDTKEEIFALLRKVIRPEFLNRVDEIVMFTPLTQAEILEIVKMQFAKIKALLSKSSIEIELTDKAAEWIAEKGYDPGYGARPIKRLMQSELLNELSKKILSGEVLKDRKILVNCVNNEIVFR